MPFCPSCRTEYREGFYRCVHCEVDLVTELPAEDPFDSEEGLAELLENEELAPAFTGPIPILKQLRAELARARIPSIIGPGEQSCGRGQAPRLRLYVAASDAERALALFDEQIAAAVESPDLVAHGPEAGGTDDDAGGGACPACGRPAPPSDDECPECGLFLGG
jgi:hypothetical protein